MSSDSLASIRSTDSPRELNDAIHSIKINAYHLHQKLKVDLNEKSYEERQFNTREALKYAALIVGELKHQYAPKDYYELYMNLFDHLQSLIVYLKDVSARDSAWMLKRSSSVGVEQSPSAQQAASEQPVQSQQQKEQEQSPVVNSLDKSKKTADDLYEVVQYQTSVLPRLYLLITVGSVYAQLNPQQAQEYLFDMLEMCRGIQHPTRGLFLRYYLQQCTRNLMDTLSLEAATEFLLTNFTEMNKLWVRMQYQGLMKDRPKREQERKELKQLVGFNLVRLSQLPEISLQLYKQNILPRVLEQIISCKDVIAQEYLMEAVSQVFSDDFHLGTLDELLGALSQFHPNVSVRKIVISFVDRLVNYQKNVDSSEDGKQEQSSSSLKDLNLFEIFWAPVSKLIDNRADLPVDDTTLLFLSMLNLAVTCYSDKQSFVSDIFSFSGKIYARIKSDELVHHSTKKLVLEFVRFPLENYESIIVILDNESLALSYGDCIRSLPYNIRHAVAIIICNKMLEKSQSTKITLSQQVKTLFGIYINSLVKDQEDGIPADASSEQFIDGQILLAKILHLIQTPHVTDGDMSSKLDEKFVNLGILKMFLMEGGNVRLYYTIPAFIKLSIQLLQEYHSITVPDKKEKISALFKFIHQTVASLQKYYPIHALKHFLLPLQVNLFDAKLCSPFVGHEMAAYEFLVSAFSIYEDQISQTHDQLSTLTMIINTLYGISNQGILGKDNYDTLSTKVALYCSRLLKKWDQARFVTKCSVLFWGRDLIDQAKISIQTQSENKPISVQPKDDVVNSLAGDIDEMMIGGGWSSEPTSAVDSKQHPNEVNLVPRSEEQINVQLFRDGKRVLECLQKALKIADSCMDQLTNTELFIEILNWYIYWFNQAVPNITPKFVNGLVDLVFNNVQSLRKDVSQSSQSFDSKGDLNSLGSPSILNADIIHLSESNGSNGEKSLPQTPVAKIEQFFLRTLKHLQSLQQDAFSGDQKSKNSIENWKMIQFDQIEKVEQWTRGEQEDEEQQEV